MNSGNNHPDRLDKKVKQHRLRRERRLRDEERSIGEDLAQIGVLGLTIVAPTLLGIYGGHWLDQHVPGPSRLFWTLGLLVAGLALGCRLAWKRITRP